MKRAQLYFIIILLALYPIISCIIENPWLVNDQRKVELTDGGSVRNNIEQRISIIKDGIADDGRNGQEYARYLAFVNGQSYFSIWQYRIFSNNLVKTLYSILQDLGFSSSFLFSILMLRFLAGVFSLLLLYRFLEFFSKNDYLKVAMLIIYSYGVGNSFFWSGLSISTHVEVCFFLLAGIFLFKGTKTSHLLILSFFAALNRETSLFIPFLFLFSNQKGVRKMGISSLFVFSVTYLCLRLFVSHQAGQQAHVADMSDIWLYNISNFYPSFFVFSVISVLPILCFRSINVKGYFKNPMLWFVPTWFILHYCLGNVAEARLFLVPFALFFIPSLADKIERSYLIGDNQKSQRQSPS